MVEQTLDAIMLQSVDQYDDSVATLFNKFIKNKKRINPLLDSLTIDYFGGFRVLPAYIYICNMQQLATRHDLFRYKYPLEYGSLVEKEFKDFPFIMNYLLSDNTIAIFRKNWYSQISSDAFNFYEAKVNRKNHYFQYVLNEFNNLKEILKPGNHFYNFNLPDTNGIYHNLSDLRGKVVILDFWFTGCGACKTAASEVTKLNNLKNDKIQFVSINVDETLERWKAGIGVFSISGALQLYTDGKRYDHPIIKFAKIRAYPTLIVLDRDGRIIGMPPHPYEDPSGFEKYILNCL
ncbi:TlpA family protein disulfide reductase [Chryseobacterium arachidis]|uniref:TlpA family protein disulfide reductase n=1 Tax=Chryseobacterium arachidis TaxID=1416778 RepID=UPI003616E922